MFHATDNTLEESDIAFVTLLGEAPKNMERPGPLKAHTLIVELMSTELSVNHRKRSAHYLA